MSHRHSSVFTSALTALVFTLILQGCGGGGGDGPTSPGDGSGVSSPSSSAPGSPITNDLRDGTSNPRLVRTANGTILAVVRNGAVYESTDDGATFSKLADIAFRSGLKWQCCGTLFELPQAVGTLQAGTLLESATFCDGTAISLDVYASSDAGKTWTYHSTPVQGGNCDSTKHDGLWEPQFEVDSGGELVMFWSDETDPCCSQKLAQIRSVDGVTWQDQTNTVASDIQQDRPGMAVVSKLPNGTYFMTYELCGPAQCTVFYRSSADGWNFGPPANTGKNWRRSMASTLRTHRAICGFPHRPPGLPDLSPRAESCWLSASYFSTRTDTILPRAGRFCS